MSDWEAAPLPMVSQGGWEPAPAPMVPQRSLADQAGRMVGQFGQNANDALYSTAMAPLDASAWISRKIGLVPPNTPAPSTTLAQNPNPVMDLRFNPETIGERIAGDVGNAVGTVAGMAIPAAGVAGATARPVLKGVAQTLASQPGMQVAATTAGNVAGDLTGNPYLGLAASLATPLAGNAAMRVPFSAPALTGAETERRALLAGAQKEGIPVSFGNIVDSGPAKMFESALSKLPFMGGQQAKLFEEGKTAFNKAALDKVPAAEGQGLDAATPGTVDMLKSRIGKQFDALEGNTTVKIDPQFGADIANAKADFSQQLRSQMPSSITSKLDELMSAADALKPAPIAKPGASSLEKYPSTDVGPYLGEQPKPNLQPNAVSIDGETYKNIRSKLSAMLSSTTGTDRQAVGGMINALDGAVERSLPKDMVQDWKDARQSWRRISMIGDSVEARHNGQTAVGNIPPGALDARAGGDREMARLAQIGTRFVGDKTPDSGTATRMLFHNMMGLGAGAGGAMAFPATTAALAAGGYGANLLMNNPYTRALLIKRLQNSRQGVANRGLVATLAGEQGAENAR